MGDKRDDVDQRAATEDANPEGKTAAELARENQRLRERLNELENNLGPKIDALNNRLDRVDRADGPAHGDLSDWTRDDFLTIAAARPGSSATTAREYADDLRRLEGHNERPVNLHPPDQDAWKRHIIWRKEQGNTATLNRQRAALRTLFDFFRETHGGAPDWPTLERTFEDSPDPIRLPGDDIVRSLWEREWFPKDRVKTKLMQYMLRFLFLSGVRPPSELIALRVDDIDLETRELRVPQPKKGGEVNPRPRQPEHLISATNRKSLRVWIETWRPRLEPETDALFPDWNGEEWLSPDSRDPRGRLRNWLRHHGKKVWEPFKPYHGRHWFATTMMAQGRRVHTVADELGDKVATVDDRYIDRARAREPGTADWTVPPLGYQPGGSTRV